MHRTALVVVGLVMAVAAPADAGLRAVIRFEVSRVAPATPPGPAGAMMLAGMGQVLLQMLAPNGPVEMVWLAEGGALRTEINNQMGFMPKGTVTLKRAGDALTYVLNPAERTYYTIALSSISARLPYGQVDATIKPTGEVDTIAGRKAEKLQLHWRTPLPFAGGPNLPPGLPADIVMHGEIWYSDDFSRTDYGPMFEEANRSLEMLGITLGDRERGRFPMKSKLRISLIPDYEIRTTVVSIDEEDVADALFAIPAGYREVPAPATHVPRPPGRR